MQRRKLLMGIGSSLAPVASGSLTASRASAQGGLPIVIGCQDSPDWLLYAARDLKLFERAGLAPTFVKFDGGPPMIAAAQNGSIDVASVGSVSFLMGLSQGVDWRMIGINPEGAYSQGIVVRKDSGIVRPMELREKRIGVFKGSMADYGLMMILRTHGIARDQVTILYMSPEEQYQALETRRIDAAATREPWLQKMVHGLHGRVIAREGDVGIYTNVDSYSVRRDWLQTHRPTAVRFLQALLMAYDVVEKDPAAAIRAWADDMGIKVAWAEEIYENVPPPLIHQWANPHYTYSLVKNGSFERRLAFLAGYLFSERIITQQVDMSGVMDVSIILDAAKGRR